VFTFYKITNKINQKYYFGVHETNISDDDYFGSGVAIKKAILKYGKENFTKQVLEIFETEQEAYQKEYQIVNAEQINDPKCYNLTLGGNGGFSHINSTDINCGKNNSSKRPEVRKKISDSRKKTISKNPEKYRKVAIENFKIATEKWRGSKHTEESKKKMSEAQIGHPCPQSVRAAISKATKGRKDSEKTRQKKSKTHKRLVTEQNIDMGKWTRGKSKSLETKRKMSEAAKLRWQKKNTQN
jgi:GIY-YIG catalytic domain/NUMOD3 motif